MLSMGADSRICKKTSFPERLVQQAEFPAKRLGMMLESYKSVVGPAKSVRGGIFASGEATRRRDSGVPATDGGSVTGDSLVRSP